MQPVLLPLLSAAAAAAARWPPPPMGWRDNIRSAPNNVERKNRIGQMLYSVLIVKNHRGLAGKITGMLLEGLDEGELVHLLEDPTVFSTRYDECISVLREARWL